MRFKVFWLTLALALALSNHAVADVNRHNQAGIQLWHPDNWLIMARDKETLVATSPDQAAKIFYRVLPLQNEPRSAIIDTLSGLTDEIGEAQLSKEAASFRQNDMPGTSIKGTATTGDKKFDLTALVFTTPKEKSLVVIFLVEASAKEREAAEVDMIWKSIRPLMSF